MKKIVIGLALILQVLAFNSYAGDSKCEDYNNAIMANCFSGYMGVVSGGAGACLGAHLGGVIAGC